MNQTENKRPTLLEWLKSRSESELQTIANCDKTEAYLLLSELKQYGLAAIDVNLSADRQYFLISTYAHVFRDQTPL